MNYNHHSESLHQVYIDQFIKDGVVVIPSVISKQFVDETIVEMNQYLHESCGFDSTNMLSTAKTLTTLSSTNGSGGILDVYYQHWKLRINEDASVVSILQSLWKHTYAKVNYNDDHHDGVDNGGNDISDDVAVGSTGSDHHHIFSHPYGEFNPSHGYMYIDRICYRLPTIISNSYGKSKRSHLQRSLTPHLDCCPHNMHRPGSKWRPIQAFIALTDSLSSEQGGFEACFGLHKQFEQWTLRRGMPSTSMETTDSGDSSSSNSSSSSNKCESNTKSYHNSMNKSNTRSYKSNTASNKSNNLDVLPPCVGDFTPIRPVEDRDILDRFQHVSCKAGDLVCWDYRIPHANSRRNLSDHPRIVVYVGLLPDVPVNQLYAKHQLQRYRQELVPTDQWQETPESDQRRESHHNYEFSSLGKKLMIIEPWDS